MAKILTAATHAPTAENSQPFVFIVVRDPAIRATIGDITARVWEGGARDMEIGRLSPAFLADVDQGAMGGCAKAPVLIVVCGDTRLTFAESLDSSIFPAVQNLLLAAHALGLGSTLTTLPTLSGNDLSETLDLPPEVRPVAVIPIGHLPKKLGPPRRLPNLGEGAPEPLRRPVQPIDVASPTPASTTVTARRLATNASKKAPYRSMTAGQRYVDST